MGEMGETFDFSNGCLILDFPTVAAVRAALAHDVIGHWRQRLRPFPQITRVAVMVNGKTYYPSRDIRWVKKNDY